LLKLLSTSLLIVPIAFGQIALTTAQIAKKVSPAVVVITGNTDSGQILGSGFIVSKDGKIVTNLHVIRDIKAASSVQLANGEMFDSFSVLGTDERRDIAVIQIAGFDLPTLEMGNSDALTVGEPLVVVGSPRGLEGSVTAGILSSVRDTGEGFKVLQTDAAVNPGNSGGPLVNNKGQAIGVVSFKLRSAEGLNFAYPINYVRGLLNNLHDPITLDQMRKSLVGTTSAAQQSTGPSLKETLDWLKEKIPLGAVNYGGTFQGSSIHVNEHSVVFSLDSCTGAFGYVNAAQIETLPGSATFRYTVPLGLITEASVVHMLNSEELTSFTIDSGDKWAYRVVLRTKSKDISLAAFRDDAQVPDTTTTSSCFLKFNDESIAQRVKDAFLHAADLCRKKEAF
jgi:hypothetical protein